MICDLSQILKDYGGTMPVNGVCKLDDTEFLGEDLSFPDGLLVEVIELKEHPWFVATQAHPEFKSRLNNPHPLFKGFIEAINKNAK